uniref:Protein arginine methyltransferase NDUFAF7 n=1 Tax=Moniliophthora roreri TaxID=221103 RepID=A0A0W0G7W7_MONRR
MFRGIRRAAVSGIRYCNTRRPAYLKPRPYAFNTRFYSDSVPPITPIEHLLLKNVQATGPMSFATYMQFCLSHPTEGYYMKTSNAVFGPKGDFITSPDISQVFGELIAIWLLSQWQAAGAPKNIRLVELGPGRATLMADILRVISQLTRALTVSVQVHLVETSPSMRMMQQEKLGNQSWNLQWHDSLDSISPSSETYTMLVAHEFFDALPFHVLKRTEEGWQEVLISSPSPSESNPESIPPYPRFTYGLSPTPSAISAVLGSSSPRFQSIPVGSFLEVSPVAYKTARKVAELLRKPKAENDGDSLGGCGLIIDYGGNTFFDNSRRAFKDHEIVDFFHRPGECDLTANVDFAYLREAMIDLVPVYNPLTQSQFLQSMGLKERLIKLLERNRGDPDKAKRIEEAALRLVSPSGMGGQYSVMGVSSNGGTAYPFLPEEMVEGIDEQA